jgi:hypothetical protein
MISIFPECAFTGLPAVIFLCRLASDELDASRDDVVPVILHQEVNVVAGDRVVQDLQSEALLRLEQPLQPSLAVAGELQEKLPLVAAVGDVPDLPGDVMPIGSRHVSVPNCIRIFGF